MTNKILARMLAAVFSSAIITAALLTAVFIEIYQNGEASEHILQYSFLIVILILLISAIAIGLSFSATKKIVKPIEKMGDNLENIESSCPYTELKPFAEKIKLQLDENHRLQHLTKQFTANLSHELKTPLTAISGYGELLQGSMVNEGDAARIGGIIYKESQRLISLSHDIIQLSQLEEYDFKPIIDSVDLNLVVSSCVQALSVEAQHRGVEIIAECEMASVLGTKSLLEELVYNLVDNAVRYNVKGGKIFISVKKDGEFCTLTVKDTGIGIPLKYQSRICERFFRVDKSRSKETGGTGLGLAIVKHTVEYLGGELNLESEEGAGTTVTVRLPRG